MRKLSLLFIPQEGNNHRALLLQPSFIAFFIALYLLNQSILKTIPLVKPGILGYSSEITVQKVIDLTNQERQKQGLSPLRYNPLLAQSAQAKAEDMFAYNYWSHDSPNGDSPWKFFKQVGYDYSVAGENLAKDFYDTQSMVRAWMRSPTHRANILHSKYQEIGVAVVNGVLGGVKTTLVVQHFGTPLYAVSHQQSVPAPIPSTAPLASQPQSQVLSQSQPVKTINPVTVTKAFGLILFGLIIVILFIDGYFTLKNDTQRLTGSSLGHISFLAIILMLLLFSRQGTVF